MVRILDEAAHAAVKKKGGHFQALFQRFLPRLGFKAAIWAVAHRICWLIWKIHHERISYIEQGSEPDPKRKSGAPTGWLSHRGSWDIASF